MPRKTQKSSETMGSEFATRLRNLLEDRGMNQSQLAAATSLQRQTISNYVLGQSVPDGDNLIKLSIALDVSVDYLLGRSQVKNIDSSIQGAVECTGLSEKAIQNIKWCDSYTLSCLIESDRFVEFIDDLHIFALQVHSLDCREEETAENVPVGDWDITTDSFPPDEYVEPLGILFEWYNQVRMNRFDLIESISDLIEDAVPSREVIGKTKKTLNMRGIKVAR